ncbi:MAG: hypothetical protein KDC53_22445 [Saprospiraceae bacterium]|nr:hypothetical protein [Saprospiraceae bacterium]
MTHLRSALFFLLLVYGCSKGEQAGVPSFLSVENVDFKVSTGQGTVHQLITEVWTYADSQFIGAYSVPSEIPLLGDDQVRLDMYPGIRENGQAAAPTIYPLMVPWSTRIDVHPGGSIPITPTFAYSPNTRFALVEDFESSNLFRDDLDGDSLTLFEVSVVNAIEGKSARAVLSASQPQLEVASNFFLSNLPTDGSPVFLELEYAAETALAVGLQSEGGNKLYKLLLFDNDLEPQKIYVNFTAEVEAAKGNDVKILFLSTYDDSSGKAEQEVIIDNIKLLHFRP